MLDAVMLDRVKRPVSEAQRVEQLKTTQGGAVGGDRFGVKPGMIFYIKDRFEKISIDPPAGSRKKATEIDMVCAELLGGIDGEELKLFALGHDYGGMKTPKPSSYYKVKEIKPGARTTRMGDVKDLIVFESMGEEEVKALEASALVVA